MATGFGPENRAATGCSPASCLRAVTCSSSLCLSPLQRSDPQLLAQFYYADEELNQVAAELDSLDGRKDPQRCTLLVSQFRSCQVSGRGAEAPVIGEPEAFSPARTL